VHRNASASRCDPHRRLGQSLPRSSTVSLDLGDALSAGSRLGVRLFLRPISTPCLHPLDTWSYELRKLIARASTSCKEEGERHNVSANAGSALSSPCCARCFFCATVRNGIGRNAHQVPCDLRLLRPPGAQTLISPFDAPQTSRIIANKNAVVSPNNSVPLRASSAPMSCH
jgi:hypothetical protein